LVISVKELQVVLLWWFMQYLCTPHTSTQPFYGPLLDHPGEPVPEENFRTLWCKGRLTDHPAERHCIRTNQCPPPPSPHSFYWLDALPAAQTNGVKALKAT